MLKVKDVVDVIISEDLLFVYLLTGSGCLWNCKEIVQDKCPLISGVWWKLDL